MFKKLAFFLLLLLPSYFAFAQNFGTIKGTVRDSLGRGLDLVNVTVFEEQKYSTYTDTSGRFQLKIPAGKKLTLVFSSQTGIKAARRQVELQPGEILTIEMTVSALSVTTQQVNIVATKEKDGTMAEVVLPDLMTGPNEDISSMLKVFGGISNNELSTGYMVRGGNFDENLIYVNDFEVYRPFLIRSGQQEGLSFANPNMVSNLKFSNGGFQARYGDKMSSVLDVTYKRHQITANHPEQFGGSFYGSLLGVGAHLEGCSKNNRFTFIIGVRQRLSQYVLRSLEEKGQYSPNFLDVQGFFTWQIDSAGKWGLELLTNYSRNQYTFKPVSRETSFGLLTDVKKLTVYFDGQEADKYQTLMNGLSLIYRPTAPLQLKLLGSYYYSREKEAYDILGEYYLSQVESDLGKSNFGEVLYSLGIGGLHDWARNTLNTDVYYAGHRGSYTKGKQVLAWGADYKREVIVDKISEWGRLDSAGYSLPYDFTTGPYDTVNNVYPYNKYILDVSPNRIRSQFNLKSNRVSAFVQQTWNWRFRDSSTLMLNYGLRFQYWDVNKEPVVTPRMQLQYHPKGKADIVITAAVGTYYQPPFYREMRDLQGNVNTSLKAQKSLQAVVGMNYAFKAWKRNFSFTTEAYYKHMWDLVPYEFDNVLIRYYGSNSSKGYAAGVDLRLNGELVQGEESWISLGIMSTAEDIIGDKYTAYYDSSGKELAYNSRNASKIVDSATISPGYIPRPTDQRVNFAMYFQDHIPKFKFIKVSLSLVFGTGLPFGPPDHDRYKDDLRIPPYRRVDMGFSGQLWDPNWAVKRHKVNKFNQGLKSVWLSLDVFNIFGITNTVSYLWVSDVFSNRYAVPNYLTSRRINAKLTVNF